MSELRELSNSQLHEALIDVEREIRSAQAHQLEILAEMARRVDIQLEDDALQRNILSDGNGDVYRFASDEVAVELGLSKVGASSRFHFAIDLVNFPLTSAALREGRIDLPRAREIVDQLVMVSDPTFVPTLEAAAVDFAAGHTRAQLAAWLRKRLAAAQPDVAETRRQKALAERRVCHYPGEDGVSHLWAQLDAADAVAVWRTIDQVAASSQFTVKDASVTEVARADGRNVDQRRADALVDLILGRVTGSGNTSPEVLVTVSAQTLAGVGDEPAELAGYGPITAAHARELADSDSRWRRVLFDDISGQVLDVAKRPAEKSYRPSTALAREVQIRDYTCRFPGCRRAASHAGIDLDHTIPWPAGPTHSSNLAALCRSHHYLKTHSEWTVTHLPGAVLNWTTPSGRTFTTHPADLRPLSLLPSTRGDPPV